MDLGRKGLEERTLAYAAGFFDGEGCIQIQKHSSQPNTIFLSVRVTSTDRVVLDWLFQTFGGNINFQTPNKRIRSPRPCWFWRLFSSKSAEFLRKLLPYIIVKKDQALLAIEFQDRIERGDHHLTQEEVSIRESYLKRMSALKEGRSVPSTEETKAFLPTEADIAHSAGILDGEGTILICQAKRSYWLSVRVTNTDRALLERLRAMFGGGIGEKNDGRKRLCWDWSAQGRGAALFLVEVMPHLTIKKKQARLGLEFQDRTQQLKKEDAPREEKIKLGAEYKQKISELNRRIVATATATP